MAPLRPNALTPDSAVAGAHDPAGSTRRPDALRRGPGKTKPDNAALVLNASAPGRPLLALLAFALATVPVAWAAWAEASTAPPPQRQNATSEAEPRQRLEAAGSGANVAITRLLVGELGFADRLHVHDSIGSSGGLAALRDGRIDVALLSRPLRSEERDGLESWPYATTELGFGVHSPTADLPALDAMLDSAASPSSRWHLLLRERSDSGMQLLETHSPALFAQLIAAEAQGSEVFYRDRDMLDALAATEGAIGLSDRGQVLLRGTLRFASLHPARRRTLYLVVAPNRVPEAVQDFAAAVNSPEGRSLLLRHGYEALR